MYKRLFGLIAAIALVAVMAVSNINFNTNKCDLPDHFWANVEALGEPKSFERYCFMHIITDNEVSEDDDWWVEVIWCFNCQWKPIIFAADVNEC